MNLSYIHLQTHNWTYGYTEPNPAERNDTKPSTIPLQIPHPSSDHTPCVPKVPLRRITHNPHARAPHSYGIVDDLAQSPTAMSSLEVLQTYPSQKKALL